MQIEIDQSGKIEQTNVDTIIGLSNDIQISIVLPRKLKRFLKHLFRERHEMKLFSVQIFSFCLAKLLTLYPSAKKVIIDTEYTGHDGLIKKLIESYLLKMKVNKNIPITFGYVGKSSRADDLCRKVGNKKIKPTAIIILEEIIYYLES